MTSFSNADRYTLVCRSQHGSIYRCDCCNAIRLRFGNAILGLHEEGFQSFCATIASTYKGTTSNTSALTCEAEEDVVLYLGETGFGLTFSRAELGELHDLAQRAQLLLRLEHTRFARVRRTSGPVNRLAFIRRFNAGQ